MRDLIEELYGELHKIAAARLLEQKAGHSQRATSLVHDAWFSLGPDAQFENRTHFFRAASLAMRHIVISRARRRDAQRRGGDLRRVELPDIPAETDAGHFDLLALDKALAAFEKIEPYKAELVKLHIFTGLPLKDCGELMNISESSAKRHWKYARAWLHERITNGE